MLSRSLTFRVLLAISTLRSVLELTSLFQAVGLQVLHSGRDLFSLRVGNVGENDPTGLMGLTGLLWRAASWLELALATIVNTQSVAARSRGCRKLCASWGHLLLSVRAGALQKLLKSDCQTGKKCEQ